MAKKLAMDGVEVKEVSQAAKQRVFTMIIEVKAAEAFRNSYIEGIAQGLGLEGKWTFDFDRLAFVRPKEDKCQDTEKPRLTEALPTSKT